MLHSKSNWKFVTKDFQSSLSDGSLNFSPVMVELLKQRGIRTSREAEQFLFPDVADLLDPSHFDSIDKARERVYEAIRNNEKILIFGDYDADGVCSTTVLLLALKELGADCDYYIPNRFTEGYGPNEQAFKKAAENDVRLIITVDTGIAAFHEADVASQLGIDLIITDHHEVQESLPKAFAIIHPKCSPDYPFKELAGVGVAFKFAEYLLGYFPESLLDLVAIGTIADLVPLTGENRIFAFHGLRKLTAAEKPGLKALCTKCEIEGNVNEDDVGFLIAPRLNAVGRLQDANLAVELLLAQTEAEAVKLAEKVDELNQKRKEIVAEIAKEAEEMVPARKRPGVIVVAKAGWNEGVLGIVASRLVNRFDQPAIVLAIDEEKGTAKGSARSIPAFDLFQNCLEIKDVFSHFGGHSQAAGMTLPLENVAQMELELNRLIREQLQEDDFKQEIEISKTLAYTDLDEALVEEIQQLAPFGMGNSKPIFHFEQKPQEIRQLGNEKKHLKIQFHDGLRSLEGIGFGFGHLYPHLTSEAAISIVGELGINEWNGFRKMQIIIHDLQVDQWQLFDHRGKRNIHVADYVLPDKQYLLLSAERLPGIHGNLDNVKKITYGTDPRSLHEADTLFIFDLPDDLDELKKIVSTVKAVNIHVCFQLENSTYLQVIPTREDFKWFYTLIWKRKKLDLHRELDRIMAAKSWTKETIMFMSKVFFELGFVKMDNGTIVINHTPVKRDLQSAETYQRRLKRAKVEKTLYFSTVEELKKWFESCMPHVDRSEEEAVYGL